MDETVSHIALTGCYNACLADHIVHEGFCDGIQLLKLYNKLLSRLVDAEPHGTSHNNKAAGLIRHRRQREYTSTPYL